MKICSTCKTNKNISEFFVDKRYNRPRPVCKGCWNSSTNAKPRRRRDWLWSMKMSPCVDCEKQYPPYVMDFDHVRGSKLMPVATMCSRTKFTELEILTEIAKCDLVCSNCHRVRTHNRR